MRSVPLTTPTLEMLERVRDAPRPGYLGRQYDGHLNNLKRRGLVRFLISSGAPAGHSHWVVTEAGSALLPPPVQPAESNEPLAVLTDPQRILLMMVRYATRPGYRAHRQQVTLAALERRLLLHSRPDPQILERAIWTVTPEGRRWVDYEEANR